MWAACHRAAIREVCRRAAIRAVRRRAVIREAPERRARWGRVREDRVRAAMRRGDPVVRDPDATLREDWVRAATLQGDPAVRDPAAMDREGRVARRSAVMPSARRNAPGSGRSVRRSAARGARCGPAAPERPGWAGRWALRRRLR